MASQIIDFKTPDSAFLLDEIFRLRHAVFKERLGWDVTSENGRERDRFDNEDAVYGALHSDGDGALEGCFRLLPTTGPNMLADVFPELLHGQPAPRDPLILESSRFAVLPSDWRHNSKLALLTATAELLMAQLGYCLEHGIRRVVSVTDVRFERVLRKAGLLCQRFGPPVRIGSTLAVAGWLEATQETVDSVEAMLHRQTAGTLVAETPMAARGAGGVGRLSP